MPMYASFRAIVSLSRGVDSLCRRQFLLDSPLEILWTAAAIATTQSNWYRMRAVWNFNAEAQAEQQQSSDGGSSRLLHATLAAAQAGKLGVCFSGAAFGASYQLGAAQILQELGLLGPHTPVAGASAGAIVAVASRCCLPQLDVLGALTAVAEDLLQHGEKGRLRGVLQQHMQQLLPPDAYQLCSSSVTHTQAHYHITHPLDQARDHAGCAGTSTAGSSSSSMRRPPCVLGATRVRPCCPACLQPDVFVGGYSSNADLLDALLTGAHIPGTSGGSLLARYRGHTYVDSGLRDPCPAIPGVDHTLIIYPVPSQLFKRPWPYRLLMKPPLQEAIAISPGLYGRPWPYSRSYKESNSLVMHPQPAGVLHMLFERGRRDALAWAQHIGLTAEHVQNLTSLVGTSTPTQSPAGEVGSSSGGGVGAGGRPAVQWLQQSVDSLPMLVDVPPDLMHYLGGESSGHGRSAVVADGTSSEGCMCFRFM